MPHRRQRRVLAVVTSVVAVSASTLAMTQNALADSTRTSSASRTASTIASPQLTTTLNASTFRTPSAQSSPWVRWVLSDSLADSELRLELQQMKAAGISGAEIGQGSYPSTHQLEVILKAANALGITISLSHGPVSAPDGFSIDDDNARKKLVYGSAYVNGGTTYAGAIPAATGTTNRSTLVSLLAYKCTSDCSADATGTLDLGSAVDLTSTVTGTNTTGVAGGTTSGNVSWTAPAGGTWALLAIYSTGASAQPDLLTKAGFTVLIDNLATSFAPLKSLLRKNAGDLFYDSHTGDRGSPTDTWSNTMAADFTSANGYAITDYLPLLLKRQASGFGAAPSAFAFDTSTTKKFMADFDQTRTDLWLKNQIKPLQRWAKTYNLSVRLQPYGDNGDAVDSIQAAASLDKVETETLWFGDEVDNYLPEASANHMTGRNWYSIEGSASLNQAYSQTWQDQVVHMNKAFAGGVTKLVYHHYPYADSTTSVWPGYSLFPDSFGNTWGPRDPEWKDAAKYNAYFARNQEVLTQGAAKTDVAVYMQNYVYPQPYTSNNLQYWSDPALERAGYTRDYLNPTLLALPNAVVKNQRLAPNGPDYKAFVFDSTQLPTSAPSRSTMPVATARKVLSYAKAGLPVIFVGATPTGAPGISASADAEVQALMKQVLAQKSTHVVASESDVPTLLGNLGVRPSAQPTTPGPVLSVHRQTKDTDYYWLYNQGSVISAGEPATSFTDLSGTAVSTSYTLHGRGTPFLLDTWTGKATPIKQYTVSGDTVRVHVRLAKEDTTVIALTTNPKRFTSSAAGLHATSTTASAVVGGTDGSLHVKATKAGTYSTRLSNGRTVKTVVTSVPVTHDLTDATWKLKVSDWTPTNAYGTTGTAGSLTTRSNIATTLTGGLKPWTDIDQLKNSSGIGVYTTTVTLPKSWRSGTGATLSLGAVTDSFEVKVNGVTVHFPDQLTGSLDIGHQLHAGANTIAVTVSTTLINRLRTLNTTQSSWPAQPNGLVGPVTLTPYTLTKVADRLKRR